MAEIYSKIGTLRNSVCSNQKSISSTLQTVMLNGQCTAGVRLSNTSGTLASLMASADTALCSAYASAASMVKSSSKISAGKYPVNVTLKKNAVIKLNYTVLEQCTAQLSRQVTQVNNHIAACTNLITELNNAKMKTSAQQTVAKVTNVAGGAAGLAAAMAAANQKAAANTLAEQMKFDAYRSTAITQINNAKKNLMTLSASLKQVIKEIQTSVNAFRAADSKISKMIADFNKTAVLKKASVYDKATSTNASGIQTTIAELEAAQKEYIAAYGHPSEEIAGEIVRLKKLYSQDNWCNTIASAAKWPDQGGELGKKASDYGFSGAWCDAFVIYMLKKAGLTDFAKDFPRGCINQVNKLKKNNLWQDADSYTPKTGDLVYFDWPPQDGKADHVGIIYVANGKTYVFQGNWGGAVAKSDINVGLDLGDGKRYGSIGSYVIGYGTVF